VQDVLTKHRVEIDSLPTEQEQLNRLCELNVIEQVNNVSQTTVVRDAFARNQPLSVHGWIYGLSDGLLRDLGVTVSSL
jgi:carbonic anhydrase